MLNKRIQKKSSRPRTPTTTKKKKIEEEKNYEETKNFSYSIAEKL